MQVMQKKKRKLENYLEWYINDAFIYSNIGKYFCFISFHWDNLLIFSIIFAIVSRIAEEKKTKRKDDETPLTNIAKKSDRERDVCESSTIALME